MMILIRLIKKWVDGNNVGSGESSRPTTSHLNCLDLLPHHVGEIIIIIIIIINTR